MNGQFLVQARPPDCPACGAQDYVAGLFPAEGQLFRCKACKTCYSPVASVALLRVEEPVLEEAR